MPGVLGLFIATGAPAVNLAPKSVADIEAGGGASASIQLNRDGDVVIVGNASTPDIASEWHRSPTGTIGDGFWARLTVDSGSNPDSGTVGSWLQLSSNRLWQWDQAAVGQKTASCTLAIAADSGGALVLAAATISVNAQRIV